MGPKYLQANVCPSLIKSLRVTELCSRPEVQRNFIAYIVDLTNVLDILFTLIANRDQENLNIRAIKAAYKAYYGSMRRVQVHAQIRGCSVSIFGSSSVVSEIVSLIRQRYVIDSELARKIGEVSAKYLEGEEVWYPRAA